jgi:large subunit ribosomal protein L23
MKEAQKIIRRPLITEKSTRQKEESRQYVFEVHRDANKIEIQSAVERLFKVKVLQVRTSNVLGKIKRLGRRYGKRPDWKKAIITLKEGDRIDFFEGA